MGVQHPGGLVIPPPHPPQRWRWESQGRCVLWGPFAPAASGLERWVIIKIIKRWIFIKIIKKKYALNAAIRLLVTMWQHAVQPEKRLGFTPVAAARAVSIYPPALSFFCSELSYLLRKET